MTDLAAFEAERPRLARLAYRMLGSVAEAEDAVQDAWLRWRGAGPETIDDPAAWLVRATTRLCIDRMRAARTRREALEEDIRALEQFLATARSRVRDALDTETTTLERLLGEAMVDRPARHEIDLTDPRLDAAQLEEGSLHWSDATTPIDARLV